LSKTLGPVIDEPSLIFIDEFQNYSPFEIQCLKSAYESPVFNLFGDYDQRIEEKGVDLKSKLTSLLSPNSYNINVNYRNAKPITEYINRQVHKNMQSIGVNGTVIETHIDQCEFKISDRTAIICKDPKLALIFLKRYIDSSRINNSITTKELLRDKFTLMTVLDCKGLEFDTVYVFDYGMTENEKYVAYTRALDTLVVISDNLEALKKAEEEAERKKKEEERLRKAELAKQERLYSLAISKTESNDIFQLTEAIVLFETLIDYKDAIEMIARIRAKIAQLTAQEQAQKETYRKQNLCQYCGGKFKGLFNKQCRNCGKKKDY
jgi:superfamily I DNA/RNA helicase